MVSYGTRSFGKSKTNCIFVVRILSTNIFGPDIFKMAGYLSQNMPLMFHYIYITKKFISRDENVPKIYLHLRGDL